MEENNTPKVSIIMSVYNGEEFLKTALDSVVNQTLKDIEIICINDGSTDNSLQILEEYAKNDDRIKIINQKNQGLGAARNTALNFFSGDYVMFLDCDDYYELNACETAYKSAVDNNVELVVYAGKTFTKYKKNEWLENNLKVYNNFPDFVNKKFNFADLSFGINKLCTASWIRLYNKNLFKNSQLKFTEKALCEDVAFMMALFDINPSTIIIRDILYNYNSPRENQLTAAGGMQTLSIFKSMRHAENILKNSQIYSTGKFAFMRLKCEHLLHWYLLSKWYVKILYLLKFNREILNVIIQEEMTVDDFARICFFPQKIVNAILNLDFKTINQFYKIKE